MDATMYPFVSVYIKQANLTSDLVCNLVTAALNSSR